MTYIIILYKNLISINKDKINEKYNYIKNMKL